MYAYNDRAMHLMQVFTWYSFMALAMTVLSWGRFYETFLAKFYI
jgi:hypothetical protein